MAEIPNLDAVLKQSGDKFETRKKWFIFSETYYRPTSEKVVTGFRYFACDIDALMGAFARGDVNAIAQLPYALDEDGDRDTSGVLVDVAHTPSFSFVAISPQQYQDHSPVTLSLPLILEGAAAQAVSAAVQQLVK